MADAHKVIATSGLVVVTIGTVNSFSKGTPPSPKFLVGSGAAFLMISALAEVQPEVAQAIALAVMTTVLLGDGGGVLSYISSRGETDTKKLPTPPKRVPDSVTNAGVSDEVGEKTHVLYSVDTPPAYPNLLRNLTA